jgi:bifunctional UDP-N-acetylglucosamine pyrophosphorylase/glucosamine-1-phosphate N-acetyltransferase
LKETVAIILAAGISKRMNTDTPKVLHEVCGRPMLAYVLDACRQAGVKKMYVVVGYNAEKVKQSFADAKDIVWVYQAEQKGTGHAVLCCAEHLEKFDGWTLVLCGDGPLIRSATIKKLLSAHNDKTSATIATTVLENPVGYGRVVRDANDNFQGIVEHKDCTPEQLKIKEINPSYYLFDNQSLFSSLRKIKNDNVQKEYYLTDVLSIMLSEGKAVSAVIALPPEDAMSVNTKEELKKVNEIMAGRLRKRDGAAGEACSAKEENKNKSGQGSEIKRMESYGS